MHSLDNFLSDTEKKAIVQAIETAEKNTSGEVRVYIERTSEKPTLERAKEVFLSLDMNKTRLHNGVLFYVRVNDKQFAILGDSGIDQVVPSDFWEEAKHLVLSHFFKDEVSQGLIEGILLVGKQLKSYFPYQDYDENELSDEIHFGD